MEMEYKCAVVGLSTRSNQRVRSTDGEAYSSLHTTSAQRARIFASGESYS